MALFSCFSLSQCFARQKSRAESPAPLPSSPARSRSPEPPLSAAADEAPDRIEPRQPMDISPERPMPRGGRPPAPPAAEPRRPGPAAGEGLRLRAKAALAGERRSIDSGPGTPLFAMSPEPNVSVVGVDVFEQRLQKAKQSQVRGRTRRRKVRPARKERNDDGSTWSEARERPGRPHAVKTTNYLGSDSSPETSRQRPSAPPAVAPATVAERHSHDERLSVASSHVSSAAAHERRLRQNSGFTAELTA